ncbi:DUF6879 family protein [Cryptosporangium minutisporangium]|uniref:DUF6879 domain-containing protein n=1 Tax=Cryptosporangium minutisporangium TaxID=113569 RepID=A0ABP6T0T3_9ACTN
MTIHTRDPSGPATTLDFEAVFAAHRDAFRPHGRPNCPAGSEQAAPLRYRTTGHVLSGDLGWAALVRRARDNGTTIRRLRLVSTPLTPHEARDLDALRVNVAAGKDIRTLRRARLPYQHDLWIFDRTLAYWMLSDDTGALQRCESRTVDAECAYWLGQYDDAPPTIPATPSFLRQPARTQTARPRRRTTTARTPGRWPMTVLQVADLTAVVAMVLSTIALPYRALSTAPWSRWAVLACAWAWRTHTASTSHHASPRGLR